MTVADLSQPLVSCLPTASSMLGLSSSMLGLRAAGAGEDRPASTTCSINASVQHVGLALLYDYPADCFLVHWTNAAHPVSTEVMEPVALFERVIPEGNEHCWAVITSIALKYSSRNLDANTGELTAASVVCAEFMSRMNGACEYGRATHSCDDVSGDHQAAFGATSSVYIQKADPPFVRHQVLRITAPVLSFRQHANAPSTDVEFGIELANGVELDTDAGIIARLSRLKFDSLISAMSEQERGRAAVQETGGLPASVPTCTYIINVANVNLHLRCMVPGSPQWMSRTPCVECIHLGLIGVKLRSAMKDGLVERSGPMLWLQTLEISILRRDSHAPIRVCSMSSTGSVANGDAVAIRDGMCFVELSQQCAAPAGSAPQRIRDQCQSSRKQKLTVSVPKMDASLADANFKTFVNLLKLSVAVVSSTFAATNQTSGKGFDWSSGPCTEPEPEADCSPDRTSQPDGADCATYSDELLRLYQTIPACEFGEFCVDVSVGEVSMDLSGDYRAPAVTPADVPDPFGDDGGFDPYDSNDDDELLEYSYRICVSSLRWSNCAGRSSFTSAGIGAVSVENLLSNCSLIETVLSGGQPQGACAIDQILHGGQEFTVVTFNWLKFNLQWTHAAPFQIDTGMIDHMADFIAPMSAGNNISVIDPEPHLSTSYRFEADGIYVSAGAPQLQSGATVGIKASRLAVDLLHGSGDSVGLDVKSINVHLTNEHKQRTGRHFASDIKKLLRHGGDYCELANIVGVNVRCRSVDTVSLLDSFSAASDATPWPELGVEVGHVALQTCADSLAVSVEYLSRFSDALGGRFPFNPENYSRLSAASLQPNAASSAGDYTAKLSAAIKNDAFGPWNGFQGTRPRPQPPPGGSDLRPSHRTAVFADKQFAWVEPPSADQGSDTGYSASFDVQEHYCQDPSKAHQDLQAGTAGAESESSVSGPCGDFVELPESYTSSAMASMGGGRDGGTDGATDINTGTQTVFSSVSSSGDEDGESKHTSSSGPCSGLTGIVLQESYMARPSAADKAGSAAETCATFNPEERQQAHGGTVQVHIDLVTWQLHGGADWRRTPHCPGAEPLQGKTGPIDAAGVGRATVRSRPPQLYFPSTAPLHTTIADRIVHGSPPAFRSTLWR